LSEQSPNIDRRGLMLVLSSPSGAGKTTLSRMLLAAETGIEMSVSVTTRPIRPGEVDGKDYSFTKTEAFEAMRDKSELLEWAKVFGNYYGTPKGPVDKALASGRDILFDIDWQGTQQLRESMREDLVSIFILPPSAQELGERLKTRAQDPPEVVAARMGGASDELSHWAEYDYVIVNQEVEQSLRELRAILAAERLKRARRTGLVEFVRRIQAEL
jgi:guanylate kinase